VGAFADFPVLRGERTDPARLLRKEPEAGFGNRARLQKGHSWPFCERFAQQIAASAAGAEVFPEPAGDYPRHKKGLLWNSTAGLYSSAV